MPKAKTPKPNPPANYHPDTLAVRGGTLRSGFDETSEALYLTSAYVYSSAEEAAAAFRGDINRFVYSRYGNPTVAMLQQRMAALEGAETALATSTGMAAVFATVASLLKSGDRLVASRALFGACHAIFTEILPAWGIQTELVDGRDNAAWDKALSTPATMVFVESPSNPLLELVDLAYVTKKAHKAGALMVVDNVFATPTGQSPLKFGVDIVVYSTTKHIDGHGRTLGGLILGAKSIVDDTILKFIRRTGPSLSPFNAWVILKSLESLPYRIARHAESAQYIAETLQSQWQDCRILYPFLASHPQHALAKKQMHHGGNVIAIEINGGEAECFRLLNALTLIDICNNLGDAKSLICHPATTTHSNLSDADKAHLRIADNQIRLSVGLEHPDDLLADLTQAYKAI
ncbi:MAG: O-succinylhomoserine sulfhydrylase [Proteobacteria bacterium]|nr:O-succinylhomoserine sulfhydrylase [Pseudomonadota bacterium]